MVRHLNTDRLPVAQEIGQQEERARKIIAFGAKNSRVAKRKREAKEEASQDCLER